MRRLAVAMCLVMLGACSSGDEAPIENEASGPPEVRAEVVARHAMQLDDELGARPAGSQQEQIASQYILGHLQRAGYLVRLDAVPVGNLVESSNLLALPPSGNDPEVVVAAPYDSPEGKAENGEETGFLIELARALNVATPRHDVEFVALAADSTGERLGSRRLVRTFLDDGVSPDVVEIARVSEGLPVDATGPLASEVVTSATGDGAGPGADESDAIWSNAGLEHATVSGDPEALGAEILDYLRQADG